MQWAVLKEISLSYSVIIPSRSPSNLRACVEAVHDCEPYAGVIFVDDDIDWTTDKPPRWDIADTTIQGIKPFIFARAVNQGTAAALANPKCDGVVLLNDDALLKTPGGFTRLAELAAQHEDIGIIAPVTNVTGQPLQMPKGVGLRQVPHIAFVCVYIPRRTIERVGMLDERFTSYGWEDNDYTHRVNIAGLKVCVYDHVFVDHASLKSTFRGDPKKAANIEPGRRIFREKWGFA